MRFVFVYNSIFVSWTVNYFCYQCWTVFGRVAEFILFGREQHVFNTLSPTTGLSTSIFILVTVTNRDAVRFLFVCLKTSYNMTSPLTPNATRAFVCVCQSLFESVRVYTCMFVCVRIRCDNTRHTLHSCAVPDTVH